MKALVTGATGFIGSHLAEHLLEKGYEVWALVREGSRRRWLPEGVKVIRGGLIEEPLPPLEGFHHVFHLAGVTRAAREADFFRFNVEGTRRLLLALREGGGITGRFVFTSSLAAAGPSPPDRPLREEDPPRPISPYGRSKLEAERVVLSFREAFPVTILRPSAVYGPRDDYMWEYFRTISRGILPVIGGVEQSLSLCYVADCVEAMRLAAERPHPSGEVFFVSDGEKYPLQLVTDMVASFLKVKVRRVRIPRAVAWLVAWVSDGWGLLRGKAMPFNRSKCREALARGWLCEVEKARKVLGFSPRYKLREGLPLTLKWYKREGWL